MEEDLARYVTPEKEGRLQYLLFIDESGTECWNPRMSHDINERLLCLIGVIVRSDYYHNVFEGELLNLKKDVFGNPNIILHTNEIVRRKGPFSTLKDDKTDDKFQDQLKRLLSNSDFTVIAIGIDKDNHHVRYQERALNAYYYCFLMLLERFVFFLEKRNAVGRVFAEARNKEADKRLNNRYRQLFVEGTYYVTASQFRGRIQNKDKILFRTKTHKVAGLEVADILSRFAKKDVFRGYYSINTKWGTRLEEDIIQIIQKKYDKSPNGAIDGYGRKLIL
ncbi:DUF3800 domain-containing protein [Candidatus Caldatribacterium saccharofermentans]|uniref:DUF3800 domain-containing protein n=1 Tax=Candidatus Caldatribacterium saccharofermentans TaxID=1454753 RepID=A0A7V4WLL6_9BACT